MNHANMEDDELERISRLIRDTPVRVDLEADIMKRHESGQLQQLKTTRPGAARGWLLRRSAGIVAAVLALFLLITSTEFISPALADSLKQIPGMNSIFRLAGDLGLRNAQQQGIAAIEQQSDSHEGLTLSVPEVLYDGIRVSLGLQRQSVAEPFRSGELGDLMTNIKLLIDGEDINTYGPLGSSGGGSFGPFSLAGKDADSRIIQFTDLQNQGGRSFPDAFELTLSIDVAGIEEPFQIRLPVRKQTYSSIIAEPIVRTASGLRFLLETAELTPITTRITTRLELPAEQSIDPGRDYLGYELTDDQGNVLQEINGGSGWHASGGNILITAALFEPLEHKTSYLVIRPYRILSIERDGYQVKEYIPEFEVKLPVLAN
ncbi:DUF4179 domain-containing protein [Paenibacillus sp. MMS20-IR301]|uniref:DUF4179 domain-containing protein n=1 Tax=Paenibacillus sp. MMS20-IR301 TaxID=2895946 RepID=UPI0028F04BE5|nr:DUF4179 domain-containing protein [Paenibacillus sp. MMS20-IR301]WNS41793.1 DUF4179 domain-containing protein [Paenibacillus sp. MMS20-IR301]